MISLAIVLIAALLVLLAMAGRSVSQLTTLERGYLAFSPLPLAVMFGLALLLRSLGVSQQRAGATGTWLAVTLSVLLGMLGVVLSVRTLGGGPTRLRLVAATGVALLPAVLVALVSTLFLIARHS